MAWTRFAQRTCLVGPAILAYQPWNRSGRGWSAMVLDIACAALLKGGTGGFDAGQIAVFCDQ